MNTTDNPYQPQHEDLWEWYALSRVDDFLLLSFQRALGDDNQPSSQSRDYREYMRSVGYRPLVDWNDTGIRPEEYLEFFRALGFNDFAERPFFSPFFHEVVEVIEDLSCGDTVHIERVVWPGWMFGNMLFSRAGVCVRCSPQVMRKEIAERSRLYFTFRRLRREASDLSHGWGSNSQWRTELRRDYLEGGQFHFNVDGKYSLDDGYWDYRRESDHPVWEDNDLTLDERIELLTNRCFVRTPKDDREYWPYDDRFSEPAPGGSSTP